MKGYDNVVKKKKLITESRIICFIYVYKYSAHLLDRLPNMIFIIHIIVSILFFVQNVNSSSPTPDYTNHLMTTWNNNSFYGFRGIRYAQPPIGNLRFKVNL